MTQQLNYQASRWLELSDLKLFSGTFTQPCITSKCSQAWVRAYSRAATFHVRQEKEEELTSVFNNVRFIAMNTVTATRARNNLYSLIDEANKSHIPIQITGKRGNAILVSEDDWKAISETIHLSTIPGMVESIKEGMDETIENCSDTLEW